MKNCYPFVFGLFTSLLVSAQAAGASDQSAPSLELIAQGRHLVSEVAMCVDCHSARLPNGEFDQTRWLQGTPLGFRPTVEMPWAPVAPPIAGLVAHTDEQIVKLLTTGLRADGKRPLPPMPSFHFTKQEAQAVIAYLRSLAPGS